MREPNPAASAARAAVRSWLGGSCSWEAWKPMVAIGEAFPTGRALCVGARTVRCGGRRQREATAEASSTTAAACTRASSALRVAPSSTMKEMPSTAARCHVAATPV
jgi:hypothetical protein